ncbi:MAG TPA: DUF4255 domain-containing protein [Ktedonobacteraceae bacterium]|nr:DUF4255 domain-containing protein [Ktedonobacteraceae bacterium]
MSGALAVASVTAVLKHLLGNVLVQQSTIAGMGDVTVSALPPDRVLASGGTEEHNQLNLYLYRLTPDSAWRRGGTLTSAQKMGVEQENLPLALDLHYLLTAYGERDLYAEILLGYALQFFYETPVLTREMIRSTLASLSAGNGSHAGVTALTTSMLSEQLERISIRPEFLNTEEMSRLWTSFQARARLSTSYEVSVVLIESRRFIESAAEVPQVVIS